MATLRLLFILVIIQSYRVLSMKLLQDFSDKHVKQKHDFSHRLFKRQVQCNQGEYLAGEFCCKVCPEGTHAASDCTVQLGKPECKACTEGEDFMDKENGYQECQRCRNCESAAGQEVLQRCTTIQNTVCKCINGLFCSDENCNQCQRCTRCDNGIAEECTSTKDTVCKNVPGRNHVVAWSVAGAIVFVIGVTIAFFVWKKCCKKPEKIVIPEPSEPSEPLIPTTTCPSHLENIELDNHLFEIAGLMGQESVQKLVTKHLSSVDREDIKRNNPNNAREEKYELLKKWHNAHGFQGAFKMLIENCTKREAEKIIDLVQKI